MYEIPVTASCRYRRGIRHNLQEIGIDYTEAKGLLTSQFVIKTPCKELYDILADFLTEPAGR